jgi:outer membrane protein assembly factor BamE
MRLLVSIAAALALCACGLVYKIDIQQGNYITEEMAAKVKPGMTKAEVRQALGTPLLIDAFHANQWDYYFSNVRNGRPEPTSRLSVVFKDEKVVSITGAGRAGPPVSIGSTDSTPRR